MARIFQGERLVLATHNPGKIEEFRLLFAPAGVTVTGAAALGLDEPEETGATFIANARLKALAAVGATGLAALADDSGLEVRGLGGAPGIHTARWAGVPRDFGRAMRRVHDELAQRFGGWDATDRHAAFVAVLCLAWPDGHAETFEGRIEGTLTPEPRGRRGFGYDPIFVPEGHELTFGQMDPELKLKLSHRRRAIDALLNTCFARQRTAEAPPSQIR